MPLHGIQSADHTVASAMRVARAHGGKVSTFHVGPIHSPVSGRTDHLPIHVVSGSYVFPADVISGWGEGNTMAGFKVAKDIFGQSFYGGYTSGVPYISGGLPYGVASPSRHRHARGGQTHDQWDDHKLVPIIAAGGEFVVHPVDVTRVGHGSLSDGHEILDRVVVNARKKLVSTLRKLPGPRKD